MRLKFFAHEENDDAITLHEKNENSFYMAHILSLSLPLTAFAQDLSSRLEYVLDYENQKMMSEISLSVPFYKYPIGAGDAVTFKGKNYLVVQCHSDHITAHLTLHPIPETIAFQNKDYNFEKSTNFIIPSEALFHSIIAGDIHYFAIESDAIKPITVQRALQDQNGNISTYETWITTDKKAIIGRTETDFYNRPTDILDSDHDIWISFPDGYVLENASALDIALGHNKILIHNDALDLYELISFETAELTDPNISKYRLSKIRRGMNNTENAQGSPVPAGAKVILFDDNLILCDRLEENSLKYIYKNI